MDHDHHLHRLTLDPVDHPVPSLTESGRCSLFQELGLTEASVLQPLG